MRVLFCALAVFVIGTSGCASKTAGMTTSRFELTGMLPNKVEQKRAFIDFRKTDLDGKSLVQELTSGEKITSSDLVKVEVYQDNGKKVFDYKGVLGPHDMQSKTMGWVHSTDPIVYISGGWAIVWGQWPLVETDWVLTGALGTTFAVEVVDEYTQRIYFPIENPSGSSIQVSCQPTGPTITLNTPGTFVIVEEGCGYSGPTAINSVPSAAQFMEDAMEAAVASGWPN